MFAFERPSQSLADVFSDSQLGIAHEALCHGLQKPAALSGDWRYGPRLNPYLSGANKPPAGWTHMLGWGQAFWHSKATDPAPLYVRNMHVQAIGSDGWVTITKGKVYGQQFASFAVAGVTVAQPVAPDADTFAAVWPIGQAFHFWAADGRKPFPAGLRGVLVTFDAKSDGDVCIGGGADFWRSGTVTNTPGDYSNNCDIGIGRMRRVMPEWQSFGWTSASADDLKKL